MPLPGTTPPIIRAAVPGDAPAIVALIRRLAAFEGVPAAVTLTEETVRRDGFGPGRRFQVLLAQEDSAVRGGVVLLESYSSWAGAPVLVVHDLFVDEAARGRGIGRALLAAAADLGVTGGCCRMEVNVLSWNRDGRRFYEGLGFVALADWQPHRLDAGLLRRLAASFPTHPEPERP